MEFKDLKIGDTVYILENAGTFRKITTYNIGRIININMPYDDNTINNQYLSQVLKKKLVDITVSCEGVQKKLTVGADKSIINDSTIGLTIATDKQQLVSLVESQYKDYEQRIKSIQIYKEELDKCQNILKQLKDEEPTTVTQETPSSDLIRVC